MINFIYQVDCATEGPDIWPDTMLSVSIRVVLDEIRLTFELVD